MTDLDNQQFDDLFEQFATSPTSSTVFRWESRQTYAVAREDPSMHAFRTGGPRPERSVRTSPWLARIARSVVVAGKQWQRVRYVVEPWTEYTTYEMEGYRESQAAGDEILLTTVPLTHPMTDFWLFSGRADSDRYAIDMYYDDAGAPVRFDYLDDPEALAQRHSAASEVLASAVTLNVYLSRVEHAH